MKKDFDCSPNNNNYKTDFENLIKLAIVHNYAIHASLPTLDKDYPNYIHKWKKGILSREDIIFNKDKPFIVQTSEIKQDEDVLTMVIGNTMHVLDFMMAYFFTHKKGGVYTALGEIGPYDDIIYAELLTRGYIEDYNIGNFYDSNQEKTNDLIKHFCSLSSKKKKIYIMLNEEDYKYINEYLNTISTCSSSPTTVYVQKNFNYEMKNNEVKIIDFNIEETVRFANEMTGNGDGNIRITGISEENGKITLSFNLPDGVRSPKVTLFYRSSPLEYDNLKLKESWSTKSALVAGGKASVKLPKDAVMYYIAVSGKTDGIFLGNSITASTGIYNCSSF